MIIRQTHFSLGRAFLTFLIFTMAYLTTVSVRAQDVQSSGDVIQLNGRDIATVTGQVVEAKENYLIVNNAGKNMKIVLDDVDLKADASTLFQKGMTVTVNGDIEGDDFGMPIVEARSVTATDQKPTTFYNPNAFVR